MEKEPRITTGYRKAIMELVNEIDNVNILMKIYTVAKTHYKILKENGNYEVSEDAD